MANDVCEKKAQAYRANFGGEDLVVRDVRALRATDLPGRAGPGVGARFPARICRWPGRGRVSPGPVLGRFTPCGP